MSNPDTDDTNEDIEDSFDDDEAEMEEEEFSGLLEDLPSGAASLHKSGENARRRVEEYLEMKRAAKELADLDSFDFE